MHDCFSRFSSLGAHWPPFLALSAGPMAGGESRFEFRETSPASLKLSENSKPVFVYKLWQDSGSWVSRGDAAFDLICTRSTHPDGTVLNRRLQQGSFRASPFGIFWAWEVVNLRRARPDDVWTVKGYPPAVCAVESTRGGRACGPAGRPSNGWYTGERANSSKKTWRFSHIHSERPPEYWILRFSSKPFASRW